MATLSFSCSVSQGFNWQKDAQPVVGHLNSLTIGDKELAADMAVTDPEDVASRINVVGVLSSISWEGGYADPIYISAQISTTNKKEVTLLTQMEMSATTTEFEFTTYDYDQQEKMYFKCFHCDGTPLNGLIAKSGGRLELHISPDQSFEITTPANYALDIGIMPAEQEAQAIHIGIDVGAKFAKEWGVGIEAG